MKEEIKNLKTLTVHQRFESIYKTMLSYCLKCRKNTGSKKSKSCKDKKKKKKRIMLSSKCTMCDSKKLRFIIEQEASVLLTSYLGLNPLGGIPILGNII